MYGSNYHSFQGRLKQGFGFRLIIPVIISLMLIPTLVHSQDEGQRPATIVARLSLLVGEVSYQRSGDSARDWEDATINQPLEETDQLYSGAAGRAEIQFGDRNIMRLAADTNLRLTRFRQDSIQLALPLGTVSLRLASLVPLPGESDDQSRDDLIQTGEDGTRLLQFEINTPVMAISIQEPGIYRVNVLPDGTTEVLVVRGQAQVFQPEPGAGREQPTIGTLVVREGRRFRLEGTGTGLFSLTRIDPAENDDWDNWNDRRDKELEEVTTTRTERYVPREIPGGLDLDRYGEWVETPEYGWIWAPRAVGQNWAPYRLGYWRWYGTYGWTWISSEPWGWIPYHYGRWTWHHQRWFWVPYGARSVRRPGHWRWSPHLVVFFGWGDNRYSNGYRDGFANGYWTGFRDGRGWLGWSPLAPGEDRHADLRLGQPMRNYQAPGGVSGLESRRFTERRIVPVTGPLTVPPRQTRGISEVGGGLVRELDLRPLTPSRPTRTSLIDRPEVQQRLNAGTPLVVRGGSRGEPQRPSIVAPDRPSRRLPQPVPRELPPPANVSSPVPPRPLPSRRPESGQVTRPGWPSPGRPEVVPSRPSVTIPRQDVPRRVPAPPVAAPPRREPRPVSPPSVREPVPARPVTPSREAPPARTAPQSAPPVTRGEAPARPSAPSRRPPPPE